MQQGPYKAFERYRGSLHRLTLSPKPTTSNLILNGCLLRIDSLNSAPKPLARTHVSLGQVGGFGVSGFRAQGVTEIDISLPAIANIRNVILTVYGNTGSGGVV